jgi:hypothetical protein
MLKRYPCQRSNLGKFETLDPTDGLFSAALMNQNLSVADSSNLPWNEACKHSLTLSSLLLLIPCWREKDSTL